MVAAALNNNNNSSEEQQNATTRINHHSHADDEEKALVELEKDDGMTMTVKMSKNPLEACAQKEQHEQQEQKQLPLKNTAAGPHVLSSSIGTPTSIIDETLFSQQ